MWKRTLGMRRASVTVRWRRQLARPSAKSRNCRVARTIFKHWEIQLIHFHASRDRPSSTFVPDPTSPSSVSLRRPLPPSKRLTSPTSPCPPDPPCWPSRRQYRSPAVRLPFQHLALSRQSAHQRPPSPLPISVPPPRWGLSLLYWCVRAVARRWSVRRYG